MNSEIVHLNTRIKQLDSIIKLLEKENEKQFFKMVEYDERLKKLENKS